MKRIDRYVYREMLVPFVTGTLIVALLFQANWYIKIAKELNLDNVPVLARVQWLLYTLPSDLKLTFPTGIALAAALSIGRMGRESEITAIRAAGAPVRRLMLPVIAFGLVAGALNFYIVDQLIPEFGQKARELASKNALLSISSSQRNFKANAFVQLNTYAASLGQVTRTPDDKLRIANVMLIERQGANVSSIITAPTGTYDSGLWTFTGAHVYVVDAATNTLTLGPADEIRIDQTTDLNELLTAGSTGLGASYEDMRTTDLRVAIQAAKLEKNNPRPYELELYSRFAAGFACGVFAFTSAVFAVVFSRTGGFAGLLVSFSVCVLYYNAYVISMDILGRQDNVPSWFAAWLPNILFATLGLLWMRRLE